MRTALIASLAVATTWLLAPSIGAAQTDTTKWEIGAHFATVTSGPFDDTDSGLGARVALRAFEWITFEAEVTSFPSDFPDGTPVSQGRWEGLFGATVGPQLGPVRPFLKARPGFLHYQDPPEPIACIAVFPPPLACALQDASTRFALDLGGGVEVALTPRAFGRVDIGNRLVRFDGPVIEPDGTRRDDNFFSQGFRFTVGGGVRF